MQLSKFNRIGKGKLPPTSRTRSMIRVYMNIRNEAMKIPRAAYIMRLCNCGDTLVENETPLILFTIPSSTQFAACEST